MKNNKHLIIIGILGVIFFTLIFFSTSNNGINVKYNFFDEIEIKKLPTYDNQLLIGEVKVENGAFLPKRVFLEQFVVCQLSDSYGDATYNLEFKGNTHKEYSDIFGSPYRYLDYVEVSRVDSVELEIVPQMYKYDLFEKIDANDLNGKTIPFYVFKVENNGKNIYNYCSSVKKENAFKIINIKFNIDESEFKQDGIPTKAY